MNNYIIERLKEGRIKAKLKQSEVAELLGIKGNTLSNYENGVTEPDIDTFCALCDIYKINPADILNEAYGLRVQGESFKIKPSEIELIKKYHFISEHSPDGEKVVDTILDREHSIATQLKEQTECIQGMDKSIDSSANQNSRVRLVNYYYRIASARTGRIVFDRPPTRRIEIPDTPAYRTVDYAIGVNGNDMEPLYHDGDMLLVEMTEKVRLGEIGIFWIDNESYVKKLGKTELLSLNPNAEKIPLNDSTGCMGKVIGTLPNHEEKRRYQI